MARRAAANGALLNQRERQLYSPSVVENIGNFVKKLGLKHASVE